MSKPNRKKIDTRYNEPIKSVAIPLSTFNLVNKFVKEKGAKQYKTLGKLIELGYTEAIKNPKLLTL